MLHLPALPVRNRLLVRLTGGITISILLILILIFQSSFSTYSIVIPTSVTRKSSETISPLSINTSGPISLNYASYYGQSINNVFSDVVVDASGNIFATGATINQGFDAVVVKYDANGSFLWETFVGGSDAENFNPDDIYDYGKIALDAAGNIYITGITSSDNFPISGAFQNTRGGGLDAFITKLDTDGNILLSSYLGGNGDENFGGSGGIAVDDSGNIYVGGSTVSSGFFPSGSGYQSDYSGSGESDAFVVKITPDFSAISGTYWGDEATDVIRDIKIKNDGTVWLAGYATASTLTLPGYQSTSTDVKDGIILGFDNQLNNLSDGSFFGGQFDDEINGLAIEANGNILITGGTFSVNDFPVLSGFQSTYNGGQEAFAAKFNTNGQLIWSSFIGAGQNEVGSDIAVDGMGNVYVSGVTSSVDFPIHRTLQETYNTLTCESDAFIFKFNADGSRDWSTYYGGWRAENPYGITVNSTDQVIVAGRSESTDLPVTPNAHQPVPSTSGVNAFISILEIACPSVPVIIHNKENAIYHDQFWCNSYNAPGRQYFQSDSCALQLIAPPGYSSYSWTKNGSDLSGASDQILSVRNPNSANSKPSYQAVLTGGNNCSMPSTSIPIIIDWIRPRCGFGSFDENELPHIAAIEELLVERKLTFTAGVMEISVRLRMI